MHRLILTIGLCLLGVVYAQSPADWWYFGLNAGVHFEQSGPVADTNGMLSTYEGCASISNSQGDLLFYTDGSTVYNALHQIMPNGTGLLGNSSSSQSAIIVPRPGTPTQYYIITVPVNTSYGMCYSLVDLTMEAGLGDVDTNQKNIPMIYNVGENVCAVTHATGNKLWIVTHLMQSDSVAAFEISQAGVNLSPVISLTGDSIWARVGSIKGSSNAKYICFASQYIDYQTFQNVGRIKLMRFNNATGEVIETITWSSIYAKGPYGAEFSPDNDVLYVSDGWGGVIKALVQYDISVFDSASIVSSEYLVADSISNGQIQIGPDKKIYLTSRNIFLVPGIDSFLHRINDPNELGVACDFEPFAVFLDGRTSTMGLPPFLSSYFSTSFTANGRCLNDTVFFIMDTAGVDEVWWNFDDPASGSANLSGLLFPSHLFTDTGTYNVTLIARSDTLYDTTSLNLYIYPRQVLELGNDTVLCHGDTIEFSVAQVYATFLWQDSSSADSFLVWDDSLIHVGVYGVCDTLFDTVNVKFDHIASVEFGNDTSFCEPGELRLDPGITVDASLSWNTGADTPSILVTQTGTYHITAVNVCGIFSDTIEVIVIPIPGIDSTLLPDDSLHCYNSAIYLTRPLNDSIIYIWSDSSTVEVFEVDTTETVWLAAFNECGFISDTMHIVFNGEIMTELGEDTIICLEDSIVLYTNDSLASFVWNTGEVSDSIVTGAGVSKNYIVTITLKECVKVESRMVMSVDTACPDIDCSLEYANVFTPNGDGMNDLFRVTSDCDMYLFEMSIYNRWGQLVQTVSNIAYGWDGYVNGIPASNGTYYFTVQHKDFVVVNSDRFFTRGSFSLLR